MGFIYDLTCGTAKIEVQGEHPETVLNFCSENGIEFWETSPKDNFCISFIIHSADYAKLNEQNGKNGCEIRLLSSRGGKTLGRKIRNRLLILLGAIICIITVSFSSLFIWKIQIEGNDRLSDGEIIRALRECGVDYGVFWPTVSSDEVSNKIGLIEPEISWISLNIRNSYAHVVVHERIEKPEIVDESKFSDVIADKTGTITSVSALDGKKLVNAGDTVTEGDVLISGTMDSETGDDRYVHARGTVIAKTYYEISAVTPLKEYRKISKVNGDDGFSLLFGRNRIIFSSDSGKQEHSCDKINKLRYVSVGDVFTLPLGVVYEPVTKCKTELCDIDVNKSAERLRQNLLKELQRRIEDGTIDEYKFSVSQNDGLLVVTLLAECTENIAKESVND